MDNNPYASSASPLRGEQVAGELATATRRFWTFVIDWIVIRAVFLVLEVVYGVLYGVDALLHVDGTIYWWGAFLTFYLSYYFILESLFGRTLGKALLGTRVVDLQGNAVAMSSVLVRSLARLIPLEPLSFSLAETWWHDSLSNTQVLRIRRAS